MQPVAIALDILQGEKNMFLGFLLPTIFTVKDQLNEMLPTVHCKPLIDALLKGLDARFGKYITDKRHILSTITLKQPPFVLAFLVVLACSPPEDPLITASLYFILKSIC